MRPASVLELEQARAELSRELTGTKRRITQARELETVALRRIRNGEYGESSPINHPVVRAGGDIGLGNKGMQNVRERLRAAAPAARTARSAPGQPCQPTSIEVAQLLELVKMSDSTVAETLQALSQSAKQR